MRASLPLLLTLGLIAAACDDPIETIDDTGRGSSTRDTGGFADADTGADPVDVIEDTDAVDTGNASPDTSESPDTDTGAPDTDVAPDTIGPPPCPEDDPDNDGDTVCDSEDVCPGGDDTVDSDGDGAPDDCDICAAGHDGADADGDGVPNACDRCQFSNPDDVDLDEICDNEDRCLAGDDRIDVDMDGIPDPCDDAIEICDDETDNDGDEDVDCDDADCGLHYVCASCDVVGILEEPGAYVVTVLEDDGFDSDCASFGGGGPDVVLRIDFSASGTYCFDTLGTFSIDTVLSLRSGCDGGVEEEIDCNDDGDGLEFLFESQLEIDYSTTGPRFLVVEGYDELETGEVDLNVSAGPCSISI